MLRFLHTFRRYIPASVIIAVLAPSAALAQWTILDRMRGLAVNSGYAIGDDTSPGAGLRRIAAIVGLIIRTMLAFLGIIFMILMITSGIRWMMARGNESEVEKAKTTIKNAAIGLLVVVLSYALVPIVSNFIVKPGLIRQ